MNVTNQCPFTMVHGLQDITVCYDPAKDWADQVNAIGGNVNFIPILGEHAVSTISFYSLGPVSYSLYKMNIRYSTYGRFG